MNVSGDIQQEKNKKRLETSIAEHLNSEIYNEMCMFVDLRERLNMSLWLLRSVARPSRADRPTFGVSTRPPPPPPRPAAAGRQKLTIVT